MTAQVRKLLEETGDYGMQRRGSAEAALPRSGSLREAANIMRPKPPQINREFPGLARRKARLLVSWPPVSQEFVPAERTKKRAAIGIAAR
jgi:hypothetical protein